MPMRIRGRQLVDQSVRAELAVYDCNDGLEDIVAEKQYR